MYKSVNEAAEIFGVKPLTIRRWIKNGKLKSVKIVGSVRISIEEIERLQKGE
jgi:excisionase family DNA binding protein